MHPRTLHVPVRPLLAALLLPLLVGLDCLGPMPERVSLALPGLEAPVDVLFDGAGIPHIFAASDTDLVRVQGYIHARERFWKMDITRRQVDGTLAELLGPSALAGDVQMRVIGLHRAAARSLDALEPREREVLDAYAAGVNHWIDEVRAGQAPLPPEYAELELGPASLRAWTALDTLTIGKGIAANLSLDIDAGLLEKLEEYCAAGAAAVPPFDGAALLFEDVQRFAPMAPASTVPDAGGASPWVDAAPMPITCAMLPGAVAAAPPAAGGAAQLASAAAPADEARSLERLVAAAARVRERAARAPLLAAAMERHERQIGSNEWGVAATHSAERLPLIANDPHLSLGTPPEFYENHLVVADDPVEGPMNVSGVTFPGVPFVILGQNQHITWGATTNPMDVTDLFADKLVHSRPDCVDGEGVVQTFCIESGGVLRPVQVEVATYRVNTPGDGVQDNLEPSGLGLTDPGTLIFTVPWRSHGPLVDVENVTIFFGGVSETDVITLQYTGSHATGEVRTFRLWNRARNLAEFRAGLAQFDVGSQNWAYADDQGNLGYFSSAEIPLREDLEQGFVAGLPPFFVRDGVGGENDWIEDPARSQGQAIPFRVLPADEMPQVLNPPAGFFANANNDPSGTALDNDPLNQRRVAAPDAIYYLSGGYGNGLRAGRITQLLRDAIDAGQPISMEDMRRFQLNVQQLDAELLVPFLLEAHARGSAPGAPAELAALASDPAVTDAVARLAAWDFSTPTGLPEGWDASDELGVRRETVPPEEVEASIAATLYNVWRGQLVRRVVDARLEALGLSGVGASQALVAVHHLLAQDPFTGVGASGVDFFPTPAALAAEDRRDVALLEALVAALDRITGPALAAAFGESTDPDDWRWGRLHRITFGHRLGGAFSLPPFAGFEDLAPDLPGMARDGGFEVVNASGFSARAQGVNDFRFGGGPVRRYVGAAGFSGPQAVLGYNIVPAVVGDPPNTVQMRMWLTGESHVVRMRRDDIEPLARRVETFEAPAPAPAP